MSIGKKRLIVKAKSIGKEILTHLKKLGSVKLSGVGIEDYEKSSSLNDLINNQRKLDPTSRRVLNMLFFAWLDSKGIKNKDDGELFDLMWPNAKKSTPFKTETDNINSIGDLAKFIEAVSKMKEVRGMEQDYINKFTQNDPTVNERLEIYKKKHYVKGKR